jgi:putative ABC transport system permease protein
MDLRLDPSASMAFVQAGLDRRDIDLRLVSSDDRDKRMSNLSRAYRVNLTVLALVALFTGAFLVFTAVGLSVTRQQSHLALLSVLGASPSQIAMLVVMQGVLTSAIGGVIGCVLGLGLAQLLLSLVGGDLGAGYFSQANPSLDIDLMVLAGFWMLAVATGVVASLAPARTAAWSSTVDQLRMGAAERALAPLAKPFLALVLLALSMVLLLMPPIGGLPIAAYASIACLLLAGVAAMPWLIKAVFGFIAARLGHASASHTLAIWRLAQSPASSAGLIAGVVAAVSLTVAMAVMVASFRDSVAHWLDQILPADVYTSSQGMMDHPGFSPEAMRAVQDIAGVARYEFSRQQPILMAPDRPEVLVMARPLGRDDPARELPLTGPWVATPEPRVFASEAMADLYGWKPGGSYTMALAAKPPVTVWLAGIYRDYGRQHGSIVMNMSDFEYMTGDTRRTAMALWLAPEARADQVVEALRASIPEMREMKFMSAADIRALSLKIFDRSFTLTYALELAALVVAIVAVATGFAGQAMIRLKEFALLAHLGQPTGERFWLIARESSMLLVVAVIWGSMLGVLMSQILIHRVNPQSFHWTMESSFPVVAIAALAIAVVSIGVAAAAFAAGRGLKEGQLKLALQQDW